MNYNFDNSILRVDETDAKIIKLIQEDPSRSHSSIAREINISQPTVGIRIKKLKESGILQIQPGINFKNANIKLIMVHLGVKNPTKVLEMAKNCPLMLNAFKISGEYNVSIFLAGTNIRQLYTVVNHHFRANSEVQKVSMELITEFAKNFILPMVSESETLRPSLESGYDANCEFCKSS
ncbi:hypothetical protein LCGC14_0901970 [marine sediment metagenome]|uniref:HTH asnC-type domain-containing protein n=1 Tax=marine sediment metagenome TaxID=412755 RepID=A0A0F9RF85_9ZZZZ|nr:AsnC family transcriptional regulator [bacterium]